MITTRSNNVVDLGKLIKKFKEKYKNIYIFQMEEQVFIYHAIGRKDYREIMVNEELTNEDREELICAKAVLHPENFNYQECEAGIPTTLCQEIIKNSYVSQEDRQKVLAYYRNEMYDVDNQINCLVLSAFPTLNLEDIENWDVPTACKYYSRAEWILQHVNGLPIVEVPTDPSTAYKTSETTTGAYTEEITDEVIRSTAPKKKVDHYGNNKVKEENTEAQVRTSEFNEATKARYPEEVKKIQTVEEYRKNKKQANKEKLTPEKLRELQMKFPEIDWAHDEVSMRGTDGILNQPDVDNTPPALRTGRRR